MASPNRKRKMREQREDLSPKLISILMSEEPPQPPWTNAEELIWQNPLVFYKECRVIWNVMRDTILPEYVRLHPCSRPLWWYHFDASAPRISTVETTRHDWTGFFVALLPDLRKRIAGAGQPLYETDHNTAPWLERGVPVPRKEMWTGVDPNDPPTFESEASYLRRHDLLSPAEQRHLDKHPELLEAYRLPPLVDRRGRT